MSDLSEAIKAAVEGVIAALSDGKITPFECLRLAPAIYLAVTESKETFVEKTYDELRDLIDVAIEQFSDRFTSPEAKVAVRNQALGMIAAAKEHC